nr:MAG TPA: hypothetical protein [Caudoviricetes sp.]
MYVLHNYYSTIRNILVHLVVCLMLSFFLLIKRLLN